MTADFRYIDKSFSVSRRHFEHRNEDEASKRKCDKKSFAVVDLEHLIDSELIDSLAHDYSVLRMRFRPHLTMVNVVIDP